MAGTTISPPSLFKCVSCTYYVSDCLYAHTYSVHKHQIPWNRSDRLLGASMWALGTQPWSFARADSALSH